MGRALGFGGKQGDGTDDGGVVLKLCRREPTINDLKQ